jgi:uncharacterized protein (DUF1800 family)
MADEQSRIASVLGRLTFAPWPGQVEGYEGRTAEEVAEDFLAAGPADPTFPELGTNDDYSVVRTWWVAHMIHGDVGVHERMVWFWHTHLTSSLAKVEPALMLRQHKVLRANALGNFRTMMQEITVDAAMLTWLDGASNTVDTPNENYSREVMELFMLGAGNYTEQDVRNGARALSGWWVDGDNGNAVNFDQNASISSPVDFLGTQVQTAEDVINVIADQEACARHIADNLHQYLAGFEPTPERLNELAQVFRDSGLEIQALVNAIVRHPSFFEAQFSRPRTGLEWFIAINRFYELDLDFYRLGGLAQMPMEPPSEVLAKAGLYGASDETRAALQAAADSVEGLREQSTLLHSLVACSPEFSLV